MVYGGGRPVVHNKTPAVLCNGLSLFTVSCVLLWMKAPTGKNIVAIVFSPNTCRSCVVRTVVGKALPGKILGLND